MHVLFALADAPRHGTGIMEEVEQRTAGQVVLPPGTFYRTIKKMLRRGLIEDAPQAGGDGRQRCYRLTAAGRQLARAEAQRLERTLQLVHSYDLLADSRARRD